MMERFPVQSSACKAIGYDAISATLEVEFHAKSGEERGAVWTYCPVPPQVLASMLLPGASVGTILSREVLKNAAVSGMQVEVTA